MRFAGKITALTVYTLKSRQLKKNALYLALRRYWVAYKLIFKSYSYLNSTGFIRSHQLIQPVDANLKAIPWMNYAFVELLNERMNKNLNLFEYGAGFSSLYFAERLKAVVSIEYDKVWEDKLRELLKPCSNHSLLVEPVGEKYIDAAKNHPDVFDVILVDGRERVACFKSGIEALSDRGLIILDDSDRAEYQEAFEYAQAKGFKHLRISGLKPFSFKREESTLFYRDGNCFNI